LLLTMEVEPEVTFDPSDRSDPLRRCSDLAISAKTEFARIRVDPKFFLCFVFWNIHKNNRSLIKIS
jgi:hypothetical protein